MYQIKELELVNKHVNPNFRKFWDFLGGWRYTVGNPFEFGWFLGWQKTKKKGVASRVLFLLVNLESQE